MLEMENTNTSVGSSSFNKHNQHCNDWLIDIDENWEPKQECCIYRVPKLIRQLNPEAYTPQVVSIGPLHHGKSELASMEKHKRRYARIFRKNIGLDKWTSLKSFVQDKKETIFNCYEDTLQLENHEFEKMLLLDAVFIIEFLRQGRLRQDQGDVLQRRTSLKIAIYMDFQLLENQLPYFLLEQLYTRAFDGSEDPPFITLCSPFYSPKCESKCFERLEIKHFTDLLRHACLNSQVTRDKLEKRLYHLPSAPRLDNLPGVVKPNNLPSAVKLYKSGLNFRSITDGSSYMVDIKLEGRQLSPLFKVEEQKMPRFVIEDETECYFRNVMALEQCHYPHDTHFCNFIHLLDNLIDSKEDVELLVRKEILQNHVGDPKKLAEMINKLMINIELSESRFSDIVDKLEKHYKNSCNEFKATLRKVYFNDPWRGTSTIAAIILLLLTLIQTICSVLQLTHPPK